MEASGVVLRQPITCANSRRSDIVAESSPLFRSVGMKQKKISSGVLSCGFRDQGHLQYYNTNYGKIVSERQEKVSKKIVKMKKMQVKLVKGLRKDLLALSETDFGLDADGTVLLDEGKSSIISEAAELLLNQLQKLKAEEKEMKRKMKEEKARLKAELSSSSSESSESSDSDCGEVVDMKKLKHPQANQIAPEQTLQESASPSPPQKPETILNTEDTPSQVKDSVNVVNGLSSETSQILVQIGDASDVNARELVSSTTCSKKIEVCMGGKCKKSGGTAILEEFQRVLGIEAAVSSCKCMGKCKVGPNVKVLNGCDEDSVRTLANSLCVGVGLEDVSNIVANILGDDHSQIGFAGAA